MKPVKRSSLRKGVKALIQEHTAPEVEFLEQADYSGELIELILSLPAGSVVPHDGDYKDEAAALSSALVEWAHQLDRPELARVIPCGHSSPRGFWEWYDSLRA